MDLHKDSLDYHKKGKKGKLEVVPTKAVKTQKDLSLAYTPGVAVPCLEIQKDPVKVWDYTIKGNVVAVISDCTAVLGLGNIGAEAGLPVMEGKCVLFKRFADIDAIPICLDIRNQNGRTDVEKMISVISTMNPSFGGINLEDIGGPECFDVEESLKQNLNIPVFHDDQHGTAIIALAGIMNSLEITGKNLAQAKIVINGAGAAGIACAKYFVSCGAKKDNITMLDSRGVIYTGRRERMNKYKQEFAIDTNLRTLEQVIKGADLFFGVSVANVLSKEMVRSMADKPIIFAMANPNPEILPRDAIDAGAFIIGTGRSDYPNQVNNVLGFPGIFRGALDTRSTTINEEMKLGATKALVEVTREKIPDNVKKLLIEAYAKDAATGMFDSDNPISRNYVIPKPLDPRIVPRVARYVAEAAMETGVAQVKIPDLNAYEARVRKRIERL